MGHYDEYKALPSSNSLPANPMLAMKSERPPERGVFPSLLNDLLSAHENAARLRSRLTSLSSAVFGETTATNSSATVKEETSDCVATVPRIQKAMQELTNAFDTLHGIVSRLEKLV